MVLVLLIFSIHSEFFFVLYCDLIYVHVLDMPSPLERLQIRGHTTTCNVAMMRYVLLLYYYSDRGILFFSLHVDLHRNCFCFIFVFITNCCSDSPEPTGGGVVWPWPGLGTATSSIDIITNPAFVTAGIASFAVKTNLCISAPPLFPSYFYQIHK